jgi:hypothetical protein
MLGQKGTSRAGAHFMGGTALDGQKHTLYAEAHSIRITSEMIGFVSLRVADYMSLPLSAFH